MDQYTRAARQVMSTMFVDQAGNGRLFDQTLWNYHFEEGSDELHPSGQAVLDRLVQQWPANPVDIYVQVAHDLPYHPGAPGLYPTEREALTARRVQAVVYYLAATRPDVPYAIHLHDLPLRAISGVGGRAGGRGPRAAGTRRRAQVDAARARAWARRPAHAADRRSPDGARAGHARSTTAARSPR
jgi:hypothetical protein